MYDERFLRRAIALSAEALTRPGCEPFAAVVVKEGRIVGEGINRSQLTHDPTSHGETEAIREACRNLASVDLRGCDLYSSCEPCALCVAAMEIAGIARLYYAAGLGQSNAALAALPEAARFPIDSGRLRAQCGLPVEERAMPARQALAGEAVAVIRAWADKARAAR
ncbi:MAG: nucleoside deaminase [Alphaproteobacteria bacterium HGW-Alphaproteobacteria-2]|nr:MAG: nucleoside deaminase [Alphaproteobacteria bacterium HGW-Alphaproteobacteria-2]